MLPLPVTRTSASAESVCTSGAGTVPSSSTRLTAIELKAPTVSASSSITNTPLLTLRAANVTSAVSTWSAAVPIPVAAESRT